MQITQTIGLIFLGGLILNVSCCGKKDDGDKNDVTGVAVGSGELVSWVSGAEDLVLSPKGAAAGQQYIAMPFATGDSATVVGAGAENLTLTVKKGVALTRRNASAFLTTDGPSAWQEEDHLRRTALNRFDSQKGAGQDSGFWSAIRRLDRLGTMESRRLERAFRRLGAQSPRPEMRAATATDCPDSEVVMPRFSDASTPANISVDVGTSFNGTDYCLAVVDGTDLVSESDLATIKSSLTEVMRRYKSVIYADNFSANTKDGYSFKPLIIIADFSDASIWPDANATDPDLRAINEVYQVAGVFLSDMTTALKRPVLYMASDLARVKGAEGTSAEIARKTFHATLAHEMQHVIMDYYRRRGASDAPETTFLDEGIAHYMEDLFGYGEVSFEGFPKVFLTSLLDGTSPFLGADEDSKIQRGAAQTLIYYLVSQKGGVKFNDGTFEAGEGINALAKVVKGTSTIGARSLAAAFAAGDAAAWTSTVGGYLGALVLDGTTVVSSDARYTVQVPVEGVRDLQGNSNKSFGMRFNGFGGLSDRLGAYTQSTDGDLTSDGKTLKNYQTVPVLWTVAKTGDSLGASFSDSAGRYLQFVRVK